MSPFTCIHIEQDARDARASGLTEELLALVRGKSTRREEFSRVGHVSLAVTSDLTLCCSSAFTSNTALTLRQTDRLAHMREEGRGSDCQGAGLWVWRGEALRVRGRGSPCGGAVSYSCPERSTRSFHRPSSFCRRSTSSSQMSSCNTNPAGLDSPGGRGGGGERRSRRRAEAAAAAAASVWRLVPTCHMGCSRECERACWLVSSVPSSHPPHSTPPTPPCFPLPPSLRHIFPSIYPALPHLSPFVILQVDNAATAVLSAAPFCSLLSVLATTRGRGWGIRRRGGGEGGSGDRIASVRGCHWTVGN